MRVLRRDLLVLCYHAVSADWGSDLAVHPQALEAQLTRVLRRGYTPRTLSQAMDEGAAGGRTLVVTFDDAYRSVLELAAPILARLEVPGTVFAPTDLATSGGLMTDLIPIPDYLSGPPGELRCMNWEELRQLAGSGWEVGSHTCTHPVLTEIDPGAAASELSRSKAACEAEIGARCRSVAYPLGAWDETVTEAARGAGYEFGVTLGDRLLGPLGLRDPLTIPRDGVYWSTKRWQFGLMTAAPLRRLRALSAVSQ
jgi:peptidoglycan/xylan/chitin deacetylase (PgdA/CDA1 family)